MDRPNSPQAWAKFYEQREAKRAAVRAREEASAAKNAPPAHEHVLPHPLLGPHVSAPGTPVDLQMRQIDTHLWHRDQAVAAVQAHRDAAAAETERLNAPHPMTQHPMASIPIPERE